ncbi:uncharacterized protein LOC101863436 isoform X2 [Aplysia californica]|uniref:Uncharacterized protein LOC101863436 isoform X2 n=1 Tax=Aplysia californica TaxID=6500 RepID=A0ABM1VTJ3_APLCA|nr:uncharacterized protein LOC101863436 isoform X2 [Aplysia californica]
MRLPKYSTISDVCTCLKAGMKRQLKHDRAELDFLTAKSMTPADGIDYRQLGASVLLTVEHIDDCVAAVRRSFSCQAPAILETVPIEDCLFYPPKNMVDNLVKHDFLGRAKVISSVQEKDIEYAVEQKEKDVLVPANVRAGHSVSLPGSPKALHGQPLRGQSGENIRLPPRPSRPPPRLQHGSPSPGLRKSKSVENVLDFDTEHVYEDVDSDSAPTPVSDVLRGRSARDSPSFPGMRKTGSGVQPNGSAASGLSTTGKPSEVRAQSQGFQVGRQSHLSKPPKGRMDDMLLNPANVRLCMPQVQTQQNRSLHSQSVQGSYEKRKADLTSTSSNDSHSRAVPSVLSRVHPSLLMAGSLVQNDAAERSRKPSPEQGSQNKYPGVSSTVSPPYSAAQPITTLKSTQSSVSPTQGSNTTQKSPKPPRPPPPRFKK